MLKIAVCEDNPVHAQIIDTAVNNILDIPFEITNYSTAGDFMNVLEEQGCCYDMVLMDIELGSESASGISAAQKIAPLNLRTQLIYISQYLQYAPDVYETKHIYFVSKDRLEEGLEKALRTALKNLSCEEGRYLYFKKNQIQIRLPQNDILYMERIMRETKIYTSTEVYSTSEKLTALLEQLPPSFVLCHRSFAVNLEMVSTLGRTGITFADGKCIPIGRTYYEAVKRAFAQMILEKV
ncbi:LytR/AlgR family response regulator transcription factor [Ruminococcus sp. 5_1_39BFAA]|uniref:LytR/AlgR family response regulator transcription factor n=1 Tax=Ruminococcus sp. 5_1_39BFAA TaxID=457412 RepID=UPI00356B029C